MSLQVKQLDLSVATFLNGALLDSGIVKSEHFTQYGRFDATGADGDPKSIIFKTGIYNGKRYDCVLNNDGYWQIFIDGVFSHKIFGQNFYVRLLPLIEKGVIFRWDRLSEQTYISILDIDTGVEIGQISLSSIGLSENGSSYPNNKPFDRLGNSFDNKYLFARIWFDGDDVVHKGVVVFDISDIFNWTRVYSKDFYVNGYQDYSWSEMADDSDGYKILIVQEGNSGHDWEFLDWKNDIFDTTLKDLLVSNNLADGTPFNQTYDGYSGVSYSGELKKWIINIGKIGVVIIYDPITKTYQELPVGVSGYNGYNRFYRYAYHKVWEVSTSDNYCCFYASDDYRCFRHNIRYNQTALWQNQSLGGAGVINQIAIKQSENGTKKWFIKKSSDTAWQSFEPNKYYSTPLLELSASETFDLKVEMGNFYDPVKEQIEIEEISVLFTPEINLPIVENLQITNETLTVSLVWDSNSAMTYHVQEAKATIAEWQTIATTTGTTFTITYTDPEQQQIPHYFRVLGVLNNGYTEPTNVVVAYPSQGGEENIYKYCNNQLLSILKNDSRLADIQEWLDYPPDKTTVKHKIIGWVTYRGERINNWVALGERELWLSFEIGVLVKEPERRNRFNSLTKPERKDYSFLIKEILYELNNRTLNDYIYDMEMYEELPYRRKDYHSISIINVILKKRIRR